MIIRDKIMLEDINEWAAKCENCNIFIPPMQGTVLIGLSLCRLCTENAYAIARGFLLSYLRKL